MDGHVFDGFALTVTFMTVSFPRFGFLVIKVLRVSIWAVVFLRFNFDRSLFEGFGL